MADSFMENLRRVASGGRVNENEVQRKAREARERGERGRRQHTNAPAPNPDRNPERAAAIRRGENARTAPELRGALRRAGSTNRFGLQPPPQTSQQAETARDLQNASPLNRVLRAVDRLRGRQNQ